MTRSNHLVILSIPLCRIAKNTLSKIIIDTALSNGDVLIVSPFSDDPVFKNNFDAKGVHFLKFEPNISTVYFRHLLHFAELVRRLGYWRKNKIFGLNYYYLNRGTKFSPDGKNDKHRLLIRFLLYVASFIGTFPNAWDILERFVPNMWFRSPAIEKFTEYYDKVTLVQSANWGLQDRILSRVSKKQKWQKILLPYTTDQILLNGYFLNDFDYICVQGQLEYFYCREVHRFPVSKIYKLGSAWFRHLDYLTKKNKPLIKPDKYIMYAGASNRYFPSKSELIALDALIDLCLTKLKEYKIIYRPVVFEKDTRDFLVDKYSKTSCLDIQWPDDTYIGENECDDPSHEQSIYKYIESLVNCDLLITSGFTTLSMDMAYLNGCGIISNMIDSDEILSKRHYRHFPTFLLPGVEIVTSLDQLCDTAVSLIDDKNIAQVEANKIIAPWDYPEIDFCLKLGNLLGSKEVCDHE